MIAADVLPASMLKVEELSTHYPTRAGLVRAVDGVSLTLRRGETLGLVGESGCGKSNLALSIAGLIRPPGYIASGRVLLEDRNLLDLPEEEMRKVRGAKIGYVFQDPMTSLNPLHTVGNQIAESVRHNLALSRREARDRAIDMLTAVGIPRPQDRAGEYPHQFSGGMRQRVMIAIALACQPILLLADEPTTALDVTIQAQILDLIAQLTADTGTSVLLITHDLAVAARTCDRIAVMYGGRIVEVAPVDRVFDSPSMPYTRDLIASRPSRLDEPGTRLRAIDGIPPDGRQAADGCGFAPRCRWARDICLTSQPPLLSHRNADDHLSRCFGTAQGGWIDA